MLDDIQKPRAGNELDEVTVYGRRELTKTGATKFEEDLASTIL
jgi:hypothetical protein